MRPGRNLVFWNIKNALFQGKRQYEESLGPLKLAQMAKQEGYFPVVFQDHNYGSDPQKIVQQTQELSPVLVGYSVLSYGIPLLQEVARLGKESGNRSGGSSGESVAPVILGGPAVTIDLRAIAEIFRDYPAAVALVSGDGEKLFQQLITTPVYQWKNLSGVYLFQEGRFQEGEYQQINLDQSPYACLESSDQRNRAEKLSQDKDLPLEERIGWARSLLATQIESRKGCYYACEFCSTSSLPEHRVRKSSPRRLVEEMVYQFERGVSFFALTDNIAFDFPEWWCEFSDLLNSSGIAPYIQFGGYSTPRLLDKDEWRIVIPKLYSLGLRSIILGVQAGSARILKEIIHRPADDPQRAYSLVRKYVPLGINVKLDFIVGHPTETEADLQKTLQWATQISEAGGEVFVRPLNVVPHSGYEAKLRRGDYALPFQNESCHRLAQQILNQDFGDKDFLKIAFRKGIPNKYLLDRELGTKYPSSLFTLEELNKSRELLKHSNLPPLLQERYAFLFELVIQMKEESEK